MESKLVVTCPSNLPITVGMLALINDEGLCKRLDTVSGDIDKVLSEIQLAIVKPGNRDDVGPTILGLQLVRDAILLCTTKGRAALRKAEAEQAKKKDAS